MKLNPSDIGVGLIVHSVGLPEAVCGKLKAWPTLPLAVPALVITGAGVPELYCTVRVRFFRPVPDGFVAVRAITTVPTLLGPGVPEITPVVALKEAHAGKGVAPKLVGLPEAVMV